MGKIGHFGLLTQALPAASLQEPLPTSGLSSCRQGLHRRLHPSLKVRMSEPVLASLCSHLPESSLPQPNRVPFKTTCHRLFKKIQLFIVSDANIVLKLHCSVGIQLVETCFSTAEHEGWCSGWHRPEGASD